MTIRDQLAGDQLLDSWQEDGLHFFVFPLRPAISEASAHGEPVEPPVAVFVMRPESSRPVSAVVVTPRPDGADAEIHDLRTPGPDDMTPATT